MKFISSRNSVASSLKDILGIGKQKQKYPRDRYGLDARRRRKAVVGLRACGYPTKAERPCVRPVSKKENVAALKRGVAPRCHWHIGKE